MEPRIWSYRGTLFPGSYCSHSHREANTGREQQGLNVLTGKASEALWEGGCARAKSHSLCLHRSSEERALNATQSHLWAFRISGSLRPLKKSEQKQAGFRLVEARCLCRRLIGSVLEWVTWAIKHIFSTGNECGLFLKRSVPRRHGQLIFTVGCVYQGGNTLTCLNWFETYPALFTRQHAILTQLL